MGIRDYNSTDKTVSQSEKDWLLDNMISQEAISIVGLRKQLTAAVANVAEAVNNYNRISEEHYRALKEENAIQAEIHQQFQMIMQEADVVKSVPSYRDR